MRIVLFSVALLVIGVTGSEMNANARIMNARWQEGQQRPFNWYYPYSYQYYYPRQDSRQRIESDYRYYYQGRCYWQYRNGGYGYYCD